MTAARSGGSPASSDARAVAALIGREPFTDFRVVVRCPHGGPAVVRNGPLDLRGRPFPTRDWLTCRALGEAVSRLEAAGGVRALEADPDMSGTSPTRTRATRSSTPAIAWPGAAIRPTSSASTPSSRSAWPRAAPPVSDWIGARADLAWPARCCVERVLPEGDA